MTAVTSGKVLTRWPRPGTTTFEAFFGLSHTIWDRESVISLSHDDMNVLSLGRKERNARKYAILWLDVMQPNSLIKPPYPVPDLKRYAYLHEGGSLLRGTFSESIVSSP